MAVALSRKYRKLPALSGGGINSAVKSDQYPAGKEGRCARLTGHTLVVDEASGRTIQCVDCGATWRDEGF